MLAALPLDARHVLPQLGECRIRQRAALDQDHEGRVPPMPEIAVVQHLRPPVPVHGQHLAYPADLPIRHAPNPELDDLVGLVIYPYGFVRLAHVLPVPLVHDAGIAELLEVHRLAAYVLPELPELLFPVDRLPLMEILDVHIRPERIGHVDGGRIDNELQLRHLLHLVPDDLAVGYPIGLPVTDDVLEHFLGLHVHIEQRDDFLQRVPLRFHLRHLRIMVFRVSHRNTKARNIALIGSDALGKDGGIVHQSFQAPHVHRMGYPVGSGCLHG